MTKKVAPKELKRVFDKETLPYKTTDEIEPFDGIIGQERAKKALEFGLTIRNMPYHLYVSGEPGTGRTSFAKEFAKKLADTMETPEDMMYIYNFNKPSSPRLLLLPSGQGEVFKEDMEDFVSLIEVEFSKNIYKDTFADEKIAILQRMKVKNDKLVDAVTETAKKQGFGMKVSSSGIYFVPLVEGEMMSEEDFNELPSEEKRKINKESETVQMEALQMMNEIKKNEEEVDKQIDLLSYRLSLQLIGRLMSPLLYKYKEHTEVIAYLNDMKEDFLGHVGGYFFDEEEEELSHFFPMGQRRRENFLLKYRVNLLTTHKEDEKAPVVVEYNPAFTSLIGEVEFDTDFGNFYTDYMKIKPGILHRAHGGFLILQAQDVLQSYYLWDTLKKALKTNEVTIEPLREIVTGIAVEGVKPEKAPLDVKVILIGSSNIYYQLRDVDDDFGKLFKIHAMFDDTMAFSDERAGHISGFVKKIQQDHNLLPFTNGAVAKAIEYSFRLSEHQEKLSAYFGTLTDLLVEASAWATCSNSKVVDEKEILQAILESNFRKNLYEERIKESILDNVIQIETTGEKIGQINGISIIDAGDYPFGKVSKITATTFIGKSGVISIEKEAELSGEIHDKGVSVISGFLGQKFAQKFSLSLTCLVGFEQSYGGVDGDSASSTELYAILSSLSKLPIRQDLAVTGSVNQWGEIQAIGGVTYKIEAFFDLCKARGLTGKQGVIIPRSNIKDLALKDEVIEAVSKEVFHIYAIDTIEEGILLLMGKEAGFMDENGNYPKDTVFFKVYEQLKTYHAYENDTEQEDEI